MGPSAVVIVGYTRTLNPARTWEPVNCPPSGPAAAMRLERPCPPAGAADCVRRHGDAGVSSYAGVPDGSVGIPLLGSIPEAKARYRQGADGGVH